MLTTRKWLLPLAVLAAVTACGDTAGTAAGPTASSIPAVPADMATRSLLHGPMLVSASRHSLLQADGARHDLKSGPAITVFTTRSSFDLRPVQQTEDFAQYAGFADYVANPFTSKGVSYTTGANIIIGADIGFPITTPIICYDGFTPMKGTVGNATDHYSLFGFDLTLLPLQGVIAPVTITLTTNRATYSYPNVTVPGTPDAGFFGFAAEQDGEYFTGFRIDADRADDAACLKNVSVGMAHLPDATAPVVAATVTGTQGAGGWYTSAANVAWSVTDPETAITARTGCDDLAVTASQSETTYTCTATSGGGTASASVAIKVDRTAPVLTGTVTSGTLGNEGWYTSDVAMRWTPSAVGPSGITYSADCARTTVSTDSRAWTFSCVATTGAGIASPRGVLTVKRDAEPPVVAWAGNAGTYSVADRVSLSCTASDTLSGVASTTCVNTAGDAYAFAVGTNTFSATATDHAGNTSAPVSTSFTLRVDAAGMCTLVERWSDNGGTANALCGKLDRGDWAGFRSAVEQHAGKKISADHAATLLRLAAGM